MIMNPLGTGEGPRHWQGAHRWQSPLCTAKAKVPTPIHPCCSLLGAQAWLKGHLSVPRASPLPSSHPCTRAGREGPGRAALGSSWLCFAGEQSVISRAKFPIPSQNTAMLGEALYSQRQTTHICFLAVGIAPTGTERTGSLLSPLPCD